MVFTGISEPKPKLFGGTMIDHLFWVPDRDPMGAGVGILSFYDHIRLGFTIDEALLESDHEVS